MCDLHRQSILISFGNKVRYIFDAVIQGVSAFSHLHQFVIGKWFLCVD